MPAGCCKQHKKSVLEALDEIDHDKLNLCGPSDIREEYANAVGKEFDEGSAGSKDNFDNDDERLVNCF
jgi:hypothetical protein